MPLSEIAIQVLLSGAFTAAAAFALKKYFEKRLEHDFHVRLEELKHSYAKDLELLKAHLAVSNAAATKALDLRFSTNQALADSIYRLRNILRDICMDTPTNDSKILAASPIEQFCEHTNLLKEQLFKSRVAISEPAFLACHEFKTLAFKYAGILDNFESIDGLTTALPIKAAVDFAAFDALHRCALEKLRLEMHGNDNS